MLTIEQIIEHKSKAGSECLDGRDLNRLADFVPVADWPKLGLQLREGVDPSTIAAPKPFTEENVKAQLAGDLAFAFEKALNKRGISASLMYEVVKMWMWVLEDDLQHSELYAQYGLPFLKAVALKYNLPNEIGDDDGDEYKYSSSADY